VSADGAAAAVWSIVNASMAQAIREITVRQGIDPRSCLLVAFGGAGPQHAAGVATELGIREFAVPANAGILSALGLLAAEIETSSARTVLTPLDSLPALGPVFDALAADAVERLGAGPQDELVAQRFGGLRYVGQSHEV